jgi:hypothetical protein
MVAQLANFSACSGTQILLECFWRVRKIADGNYYLRRVCPYVRPPARMEHSAATERIVV